MWNKLVGPNPATAPLWFRFLWRRTDRAYGYGWRRSPDESTFRYAFGNAYESTLQTHARRKGWVDLPVGRVTPSTPLWWVFVEALGLSLHGEIDRRWQEWRNVA